MKIAFILYGFFRTFDFVKEPLKEHVLDAFDMDVFFSTPDTVYARKDDECSQFHGLYSRHDEPVDERIIDFFGNHLKAYEIRQYSSQFYKDYMNRLFGADVVAATDYLQPAWRNISMLHGISLSLKLFKSYVERTKTHYDLVFLTRPDIRYYENIHPERVDLTKVNCPAFYAIDPREQEVANLPLELRKFIHTRRRPSGGWNDGKNAGINDNILCGSQENILKFANLFDMIPFYKPRIRYVMNEILLCQHIVQYQIPICATDFAVYELWRPDRYHY